MFGRPLLYSEKLPALGDSGDIVCFDPLMYAIGMRQEMAIDISNSAGTGWVNDYLSLRCILRADGQPLMDSAVTPLHGTSLSWAAKLAAR